MEKAFAMADHFHINEGKTAVYHTLDERVVYVIFLKKTDWAEREKQEVFRCPFCRGFVFPKQVVRSRGNDYKHICKGPKEIGIAPARGTFPQDKEVSDENIAAPA